MTRFLSLVILSIILVAPAKSADLTGTALLALCVSKDPGQVETCAAYIRSTLDRAGWPKRAVMKWKNYPQLEWSWCPNNAQIFDDAEVARWYRKRWVDDPSEAAEFAGKDAVLESFKGYFRACAEAAGSS